MTHSHLINEASVRAYIGMLFGDTASLGHGRFVCVRGIGEKGTDKEGIFRENLFHVATPVLADEVLDHVKRWADHGIAAYILPATLKTDNASDENVNEFTTLMVDVDSGDTNKKRDHLAKALGWPTMIVASGGITETGNLKLHLYWRLEKPTSDKARVGRLREMMAQKAGGDWQFKKPAQVVRIAGSVHAKDNKPAKVEIIQQDDEAVFDLDVLAEKIEAMGWFPGVKRPDESRQNVLDFTARMPGATSTPSGGMDFSRAAGVDLSVSSGQAIAALTTPVHEGGDEDRNRWSEFSRVAGHYIHCARLGQMSVDEARDFTRGWMAAYMVPAWPEPRFEHEFQAVLNHDLRTKGPMPAPKVMPSAMPMVTLTGKTVDAARGFSHWSIGKWARGAPPAQRYLVPGWIEMRKQYAIVAEGGAGKSFMMLDLALKLAAASGQGSRSGMTWLGKSITDEAMGGVVVMITAEDDRDDIHQRLHSIDPDGSLREAASDTLRILPLIDMGGAFTLVRKDNATGEAEASQKWNDVLNELRHIRETEGRKITMVIIDTMAATIHGEDTSSRTVTEYFNQASRVCGEFGAACVVTHHMRKISSEKPPQNADDAFEHVRGSGAVSNACRGVFVMWHNPSWRSALEALGEKPEVRTCYQFTLHKTNAKDTDKSVRTLVRSERGVMVDRTDQITTSIEVRDTERKAWIVFCAAVAAKMHFPYTATAGGNTSNSMFDRKNELPAVLDLTRGQFAKLLRELEAEKRLKRGKIGGRTGYLDVPGGVVATGNGSLENGAFDYDWSRHRYHPEREVVE